MLSEWIVIIFCLWQIVWKDGSHLCRIFCRVQNEECSCSRPRYITHTHTYHFKKIFLILSCMNCLYILEINPKLVASFANYIQVLIPALILANHVPLINELTSLSFLYSKIEITLLTNYTNCTHNNVNHALRPQCMSYISVSFFKWCNIHIKKRKKKWNESGRDLVGKKNFKMLYIE